MRSRWWTVLMAAARPEELPLLGHARPALEVLLRDELAPRRRIAATILGDPALALRVLREANAVRRQSPRGDREVSSLEEAAHLLGTRRLARMAGEATLADTTWSPARLVAYRRGCGRSLLAARLALDWAELDHDRLPAEVGLAALLNNLGELFLLAHGDARIGRYLHMVEVAGVYPHEAEYVSLGDNLEDLGHGLACRWGLPEMVRESMRARNARHARTLGVMLANQMARYALSGWRHPNRFVDLCLAARLLDLDLASLVERINGVLRTFNKQAFLYDLEPLALLPLAPDGEDAAGLEPEPPPLFCLAPRLDDYQAAITALDATPTPARDSLIGILLRGLHRGLGLNRVVFAAYLPDGRTLVAEHLVGTDFEPGFNRFGLALERDGLRERFLKAPLEFWLNETNRADPPPGQSNRVRDPTAGADCFARSLWVDGHPIGLVYADRRSSGCALDARAYRGFLRLVALAERRLNGSCPAGDG